MRWSRDSSVDIILRIKKEFKLWGSSGLGELKGGFLCSYKIYYIYKLAVITGASSADKGCNGSDMKFLQFNIFIYDPAIEETCLWLRMRCT